MIIEFSITNFRSILTKQVFSTLASSARSKPDNIFETELNNGEKLTLFKSAVIYGANASGKSNIVNALWELRKLVIQAELVKIDEPLSSFKPFLFNTISQSFPTEFEIIFIAKNNEKYRYYISFNHEEITKEELFYYPKKSKREIFTRLNNSFIEDPNIHIGELGKEFSNKKYKIHRKIPLLSIFGNASDYHPSISPIHIYFKDLEIHNATNSGSINRLSDYIKADLQKENNIWLKQQLELLIRACDTQINSFEIDREHKVQSIEKQGEENRYKVIRKEVVYAKHKIYDGPNESGYFHDLPLKDESTGTNRLFALGGLILMALKNGSVIFFDELDSSLHPFICRFLLKLFLNPVSNPKNAQLIFTSHDSSLMDKQMLRSDQIWFTEKTEQGETELFSAQDFKNVREDIPFDKWYMEGKFGAVPHIEEIAVIFNNEKKKEF